MRIIMMWFLVLNFTLASCDNSHNSDSLMGQESTQKDEKKKGKDKKKDKKDNKADNSTGNIPVSETWEMPAVLTEISGITWYAENKIAAVQDESGVIFIYNLLEKKVEKEIPFAGKGDYEGIAMVKNIFYVLRSDGTVIEVSENGKSKQHDTPLTTKN